MKKTGLSALILILANGCVSPAGTMAPGISKDGSEGATAGTVVLGYNSLRARVFEPNCISCHGQHGGVNLETYASAILALDRIRNEVLIEQSMPPSGPLDTSDQQLVRAWLDAGAPENDVIVASPSPSPEPSASPAPSPEPSTSPAPSPEPSASPAPSPEPSTSPSPEPSASPAPSPVPSASPAPSPEPSASPAPSPSASAAPRVTFADVQGRIFVPQCLRCHDVNSGHPRAGVSVNTYENVITFLPRIKNEALTEQSMPPSGPLSADDQALLQAWITEGAPQN